MFEFAYQPMRELKQDDPVFYAKIRKAQEEHIVKRRESERLNKELMDAAMNSVRRPQLPKRTAQKPQAPMPVVTSLPAWTKQGKPTYLNWIATHDDPSPIPLICWHCDTEMNAFFIKDGHIVCGECYS